MQICEGRIFNVNKKKETPCKKANVSEISNSGGDNKVVQIILKTLQFYQNNVMYTNRITDLYKIHSYREFT